MSLDSSNKLLYQLGLSYLQIYNFYRFFFLPILPLVYTLLLLLKIIQFIVTWCCPLLYPGVCVHGVLPKGFMCACACPCGPALSDVSKTHAIRETHPNFKEREMVYQAWVYAGLAFHCCPRLIKQTYSCPGLSQ